MTKVTVLIGQYWKRESGYSRWESDKTLAGQMNKMLELIYYKTKLLKVVVSPMFNWLLHVCWPETGRKKVVQDRWGSDITLVSRGHNMIQNQC